MYFFGFIFIKGYEDSFLNNRKGSTVRSEAKYVH